MRSFLIRSVGTLDPISAVTHTVTFFILDQFLYSSTTMFSTFRNRALVKIYIIPLLSMISQSMVGAISVVYALDLGASVTQVNLISTIRSTMGIFLMVPFGMLSDQFGRRPMLLIPRTIALFGVLIRAFATEPNHLLIAAFVGGFAGGGFWPVLLSMISDLAEPEEQREAIGTMWLFSSGGMLLGPFIGSLILTQPQVTLRKLYQFHVIVYTGILLYMATQIKETNPQTIKKEKRVHIPYRTYLVDLIRNPGYSSILVIGFSFSFFQSVMNTYIPIYARVNLGLSNAEISSLTFYRNMAVILIRFSSATFLTKVSMNVLLISFLALGGISGLSAPLADSYLSIVLTRFLSGASYGGIRVLETTLIAQESEPGNRGIANSLCDTVKSTGRIFNILTSSIAETKGLTPVFIIGGVSALTAILPAYYRRRRVPQVVYPM